MKGFIVGFAMAALLAALTIAFVFGPGIAAASARCS